MMLDNSKLIDHEYCRRAALYLQSSQSQHTGNPHRPPFVPIRVRLIDTVRGDWPIGHMLVAEPGEYDCTCNQWGAASVKVSGTALGITPDEFVVLEWVANPAAGT